MSSTPGEIGTAWTGTAATAVKSEMTGLGDKTKQFAPKFTEAAEAIGTFVTAVHTCQSTIDTLNRQWDQYNQDCTDAINRAKTQHDTTVGGLDDGDTAGKQTADSDLGVARGRAADALRYQLQGLQYGYTEAVSTLRTAAKALGDALEGAVVLAVPDETVRDYKAGGDVSGLLSSLRRAGVDALGDELHLPHDKQSQADGADAAEAFNDFADTGPHTDAELQAMLDRFHISDEAFRQGFLDDLDPQALVFLQRVAHMGASSEGNAKKYGEVITAISQMMAQGSNVATQGTYPVRHDFYDDWQQAAQDMDVTDSGEAELFIAEVLQAGQGDPATWDSALATQIARDTIAFERRKTEESGGTFTWGDILRGGYDVMPTQAARDITPNAGQADALQLVFDALGKDPVAAQDTLLDSDGGVDHDLLHYLYGGRSAGGNAYTWGDALGGTLEAATSYVGPGGEGTRNYDSADIVQDMVHWYGTHPDRYPITMDQHVVDILSHHIQAVNYAGSGAEGPVSGNHADGLLEYQRIALANLDKGDLANLLKNVFGEDYYAQHGEHADPSKGFPMYQQLSAAQQAAFRRDFLEITGADPFDQGRLEALAHQQGSAQNDMALNLRDALKAQGASADQADADAKAAFDFVLGLGIDQLPMDKLGGPAGSLGGAAIDAIKDGALNAIFPDHDYEGQANSEGLSVQEYLRRLTPLQYVGQLEEAGMLDGPNSPDAWAQAHPDEASFMRDGQMVDLADLYAHRADRPDQWNDFLYYYQEHGQSALNDLDLTEQFELGFLTSDDTHSGSGG
ncbi:hypothetical protein GCM10028814_12210 [Angustibacter aerolatus]